LARALKVALLRRLVGQEAPQLREPFLAVSLVQVAPRGLSAEEATQLLAEELAQLLAEELAQL
jgi:hypothetical protein